MWKPVVGFGGRYEVSDEGRVRSLDCVVLAGNRWGNVAPRRYPGRVLSPGVNAQRSGRRFVNLHNDTGSRVRLVAHLVAEAFVGPRPEGKQVCHNNGDATDDRASNLRYDTPKGNMADCVMHGTRKTGENHPAARLTREAVDSIRAEVSSGALHRDVASRFGVHPNYVSLVVSGKRWAT